MTCRNRWIRANARDAAGKLIMIGNPIYVTNQRAK
jgi:hypothetical protein